jgi:hypothetical protein
MQAPESQDRSSLAGSSGRFKLLARVSESLQRFVAALVSLNYQYASKRRLFGWPLLSINLGFDTNGQMREAKGWVAIGTRATGIFAFGLFVARGIFAVGTLALGLGTVSLASIALVTVSVVGLGVVSVSVFAVGYLAIGILAIGYKSLGIIAIGRDVIGVVGIGQHVDSLFSP